MAPLAGVASPSLSAALVSAPDDPDAHASLVGQKYIAVAKYTGQFSGTLNVEKFLEYLVEHGHIPDDHYVNDVEVGNEVLDGSSGVFWLKSFDVQARQESGRPQRSRARLIVVPMSAQRHLHSVTREPSVAPRTARPMRAPHRSVSQSLAVAGLLLALGLAGCDAGSSPSSSVPTAPAQPPEPPPPPSPTEPPPQAPATSYELQASALLSNWGTLLGHCAAHAVAYGDFDGDGDEDVFVGEVSHNKERSPWELSPEPTPVMVFLNEGGAGFRRADEMFLGPVPQLVHPRKVLPGDFNGDDRLDIFVAAHGFDLPPFAGEPPLLLLATEGGFEKIAGLEHTSGFLHGAASGDIDADGDLDILVTDHLTPFALVNDGAGNFTFSLDPIPATLSPHVGMYTVELIYLDGDPYVDLVAAGHEHEGMVTRVYWGDHTGRYREDRRTSITGVEGWGIVVDIDAEDLNGDGNREIILDRTKSGPFYEGFYIQVLTGLGEREFEDGTDRWITDGTSTEIGWLDWLRVVDLDEDGWLDLFADDCMDHGLRWMNDGTGRLRRRQDPQ